MIRIDPGRYVVMYLKFRGLTHRYAVPAFWTVGNIAASVIDERFPRTRMPRQRFTLADADGKMIYPALVIGELVTDPSVAPKFEVLEQEPEER